MMLIFSKGLPCVKHSPRYAPNCKGISRYCLRGCWGKTHLRILIEVLVFIWLNNTKYLFFCYIKSGPGKYSQWLEHIPLHQKGSRFDSWLGHKPRLWVGSLVRDCMGGNRSMSLFLSKSINICSVEDKNNNSRLLLLVYLLFPLEVSKGSRDFRRGDWPIYMKMTW